MSWVKKSEKMEGYYNYMIAFVKDGIVRPYNYFSQIHYGNDEQAEWFLNYVKKNEPTQKWKIIKILVD